jgi:hypothetical protein
MAKLLKKIAKTVYKATKKAGLLSPMTLIKVTPGTRTPGAVSGGTHPTETSFTCDGIEEDYTAYQLANQLAKVGDKRIRIFGASLKTGTVPEPNDKVTSDGTTYRIIGPVGRDAASACYVCQCRK